MRGAIPTPLLPERALRELAAAPTSAAVVALLVSEGHPYGPPLVPLAVGVRPNLFQLALTLDRMFADRALESARTGGRALLTHVRGVIDLDNAFTALLFRGSGADADASECFLPGGARLGRDRFVAAAAARDEVEAGTRLAEAFTRTAYAPLFARHAGEPERLEDAALAVQIRETSRDARLSPLGPAPLIAYALRLRAEVRDLRRIAWGMALGAPRATVTAQLVTA